MNFKHRIFYVIFTRLFYRHLRFGRLSYIIYNIISAAIAFRNIRISHFLLARSIYYNMHADLSDIINLMALEITISNQNIVQYAFSYLSSNKSFIIHESAFFFFSFVTRITKVICSRYVYDFMYIFYYNMYMKSCVTYLL